MRQSVSAKEHINQPISPSQHGTINNYGSITTQNGKLISVISPVATKIEKYCKIKANSHKTDTNDGNASVMSISFSVLKTILGCGVLSLPWATANIGLTPTFILIGLSLIMSFTTCIFLIICADELSVYEYRDIGLRLFGNKFAIFIDLAIIFLCFMLCLLYLTYIGEFISNGLTEYGLIINKNNISDIEILSFSDFIQTKFFILTVVTLFICIPLTLAPKLDYLKYSSIVGMLATFMVVIYIAYQFFINPVINENAKWIESTGYLFCLESFGIFSTVFFSHFNIPSLYSELKGRSVKTMTRITTHTYFIVLILNLFIIVPSYLTFANQVQQNVIASLIVNSGSTQDTVAVLRILMSLNMIGSYPLLFWALKVSIKKMFLKGQSNSIHLLSFVFINLIVWIIAVFESNVGEILSFTQAIVGNFILYIFPTMFYLKMNQLKAQKLTLSMQTFCYFIIVFGVIAMFGGIISTVMNLVGYT